MHGYRDSGLEVVPSDYPEARYNQQHFAPEPVHHYQYSPPEVVPQSGLEPAHDPSDYPPQLANDCQSDYRSDNTFNNKELNTVTEGSAKKVGSSKIEKSGPSGSRAASRKKWRWIALATAVVVLAAIGVGVGLTVGRRSSSTSTSRSSQSPGSSGSTGSPTNPPSGLPSGPASSGLPYISPTSSAKESILHNTSMAAVSCGIGDRWVFLQDKDGLIRGAQFSASTSDWSVSSNAYSFQTASMGTTVAASCSNASAFGVGGPATVINVVYMNDSNALQQSIYDGNTWTDTTIIPPLQMPNNNSKISISSGVLPLFSDSPNSSFSETFGSNWFSVALYESGRDLVMIDLISDSSMLNQSNEFSHFDGVGTQSNNEGFSCIHNGLAVPDGSELYQQCFFGRSTQSPPDSVFWQYNRSSLKNNDTIKPITLSPSTIQSTQLGSPSADLSLFLLPNKRIALVQLLSNSSVALYTGKVASALSKGPFIWPVAIPTAHISATSLMSNSTTIYVYYQANASALAELSSDTLSETWAQPVYIAIP